MKHIYAMPSILEYIGVHQFSTLKSIRIRAHVLGLGFGLEFLVASRYGVNMAQKR